MTLYIHNNYRLVDSWIDFHIEEDQTDDNIEDEQKQEEEVNGAAESGHGTTPHPNLVPLTILQEDPPTLRGGESNQHNSPHVCTSINHFL